jgi:hypothetical protein
VEAKLLDDCLPEGGDGASFIVGGAVLGHLVAEMVGLGGGSDLFLSC